MKSLLKSWSRPGLIVLAALIAGTAFSAPFFFRKTTTVEGKLLRTPKTHDLAQHLAVMEQFDKVLRTGVLYPRWLPDVNNGYGLPWTNFYPPGLYYLASLTSSALNDSVNTLFLVSALSLAASGLALYALSRQMYGRLASAVAAVVYVAAPYHILDLYWRGAVPELAGFVLAPIIIYFAFKLGSFGRARDYAGLGFFHGLFVMTHIPVAFLMSYALMFYALVWAARERDWRIAVRITSGIAIAFVLSGIYWLPAFFEIKSTYEHFSSTFQYHGSYITLLKSLDRFGEVLNVSFAATAVAVLTAVAILSWCGRPANEKNSGEIRRARDGETQTRLWIVMGFATTFMCTSLSIYVSKLIPKIDIASFPWRWMVLASLFAALLVGAAVDRLQKGADLTPRRLWACRAAISAVVVLNIWITTQAVVVGAFSNQILNPPPNFVEASFTPKGSTDPQDLPETPLVITQPAGGTSEIIRWDPEHREVHVNVREPSRVRLKTYNFPGWVARVDGKSAPMLSDKDGIQVVEVPAGVHKIETWFSNTIARTAGALLSALGLLAVIGLAAIDRIREVRSADDQATPGRRLLIRWLKPVAPVLAPVLIGAVILFWLSSRGSSNGESKGQGYTSKAAVSATATPEVQSSTTHGPEAVLHLDGVPSIFVAVDEHSLSEVINAVAANDTEKVDALVQSGRLLRVANDTHVRVLESVGGKTLVRILQGEHLMSEGWVQERWIR